MQAKLPIPKGYTPAADARFRLIDKPINLEEGGLVDDPHDRGGLTSHGVTLRFLQAEGRLDPIVAQVYDLDHDGDLDGADIRLLTADDASDLFRECLWIRTGFWKMPPPLDGCLLDQAVNCGVVGAVKLLQRAINKLSQCKIGVDGVIGDQTMIALRERASAVGMPRLVQAFREAAIDHYRAICHADPEQLRFLDGWINRAEALGHV